MLPKRVQGVVARDLDNETVLLGPDCNHMVVLSPMGGVIWELCDGDRTVQQMAQVINESTRGGTFQQVTSDIETFLSQLNEAGFVTGAEPCTPPPSGR